MRQSHLLFIDLFLTALATVAAVALRDNFEISAERLEDITPYLLGTLGSAALFLPLFRTSRSVWQFTSMADYLRILAATCAIVMTAVALGFVFNRMDKIARALPLLQGLLILFSLVGARILMRLWRTTSQDKARARSVELAPPCRTALIVGVGELATLYARSIALLAPGRVSIAGLLSDDDRHVGRSANGHKILGTPEQISHALRQLEVHGVFVDVIVVATPFERLAPEARSALLDIEQSSNVELEFLADQLGLGARGGNDAGGAARGADARGVGAAFSFDEDELDSLLKRPYWRVKRALDIVGAVGLMIILFPLGIVALALAALDVGAPLTFWQQRPGLHGRPFRLYKIRTMAPAHDAHGRRVPDEIRTTAIGRFARRVRFDELPQLFNILVGEMSFIGPRPLLPVDQPAAYAARLLVRPGLTGWAQVNGGRVISAADKAALDVWYVRNASIMLDIEIVLRTIAIVFLGERVDVAAIRGAWRELRQAGIYRAPEQVSELSESISFIAAARRELVT